MKLRNAFTMTELIFVIVVIGILAAIAIPKVGSSVVQAQIASAKADVMSLRSSILNERQKRLMRGTNNFIPNLSNITGASSDGDGLFGGDGTNKLFTYAKISKNASGHWRKITDTNGNEAYNFTVNDVDVTFEYDNANGTFTCVRADTYCTSITE